MSIDDRTWLASLPKVELHLHLEGAIPLPALWQLIQKAGGDPTVTNIETMERRFEYRDFGQFIETWVWKNSFLREYDDFSFISEAVARDLASQNVRYAEVFFSPTSYANVGLDVVPLAEAIRLGLARVTDIDVALVLDFVRDSGPQVAEPVLELVPELVDFGVIGIGIGGSEHRFPPEPFEAIYRKARELGLKTSAHAGEAAGPESIWGAIDVLEVDRIGHGTRAIEDERLMDELAARQIPVECCPISNLRTGVIRSIAAHPIRRFIEWGIPISINTDDPKMFQNSLVDEYEALMSNFGMSRTDIVSLILQAVQCSWLNSAGKSELAESIRSYR